MADFRLGAIESQFADIIWENEPILSSQLTKLAEKRLSWKKSTTYTVLRRLCERGLFQNANSVITSLVSRDEFYAFRSESFLNETFEGSLPAFLVAFGSRNKLSESEITELKAIIDGMRG